MLSLAEETVLTKNNLIGTLSKLNKEYSVSFDVKPTTYGNHHRNILHVTLGGDSDRYGDRTPGVWFSPSNPSGTTSSLLIISPINGAHNEFNTKASFPTNKWIGVKIDQTKVGAEYFYAIHIDGVQVYKVMNTDARDYSDLKVYAGDNWFTVQAGSIRNLDIVNFWSNSLLT